MSPFLEFEAKRLGIIKPSPAQEYFSALDEYQEVRIPFLVLAKRLFNLINGRASRAARSFEEGKGQ